MQTFLPYSDFQKSLQCLDYRRLGKQRIEAAQILATLGVLIKRPNGQYFKPTHHNHPILNIWKDYIDALKKYYNFSLDIWVKKGYNNNLSKIHINTKNIKYPSLIGYEPFHQSHRSNLLRKKPEFYSKYNWDVPNNLSYIWKKG